MSGPTLFVQSDVSRRATALIGTGEGAKVKEGVELLLTNDVPESGPGVSDAGALLQRGLGLLASSPYEALGIPVGCGTIDVRKAYKKMALKYHPDKNPKTTPLFHAMKTATDKLTDAQSRRAEAAKASNKRSTPAAPAPAAPRAAPAPPAAKPAYQYPGQQVPRPAAEQPSARGGYYSAESSDAYTGGQGQARPSYKYKYSSYGEDEPPTYSKKAEAKPTVAHEQAQHQPRAGRDSAQDKKPERQPPPPPAGGGRPAPRRPAPYEQYQPSQPGPYNFNEAQARARNRERVRAEAKRIEEEEREANRIRFREQQLREELRKEKERADFIRQERLENEMRKKRLEEERMAAQRAHKERIRVEEAARRKREEEEEVRRAVQLAEERQRAAEEARRKAASDAAAATATPDERARKWGAPHYSNIPLRRESGGYRAGQPSTFTANAKGEVSSGVPTGGSSPTRTPPIPTALRCISHDSTSAELAWAVPQYPFSPSKSALLTELSWKNASSERAMWDFSPQLISASQVRKKNLTPGSVYEFKVRLVFLPRGRAVLTDRVAGPWSKAIVVMMSKPPDRTTKTKEVSPSKMKKSASSSRPYSPINIQDDDLVTGQKLSESVRRAWYNDTEKKEGEAEEEVPEEEFYPRRVPSFHLGRTMFGKAKDRDPSPEPEEIDSDSGDDGKYIAKKATPTSSATKPRRDDFADLFCESRIDEGGEDDEEILDETESSHDGRAAATPLRSDEVEETGAREFVDSKESDDDDDEAGGGDDFFAEPADASWPDCDIIHECVDDSGNVYYYNEKTKESDWCAPEWVEETDEQSGARYYVHLNRKDANPLASTWSKPKSFAKIVRNRRTKY